MALLLILAGCAAPAHKTIQAQPRQLPARAAIENVPFYPQEKYYCGPASLAMMLSWTGMAIDQASIVQQVYTPGRQGTLPVDLLSAARRNGVLAVQLHSLRDLLEEIAAGHPVLVFQNLGIGPWPQWHFAVAYEYDLRREVIVLRSGTNERRITDLSTFERTWGRADYWAITITPPDQLPASATANAVVNAAAGLERTAQYAAAATAYETIIRRWPDNLAAAMGLGNTLYASGKYSAAARRYRAILARRPGYAPAWNNLAYALQRLGRKQEAIEAAQRAASMSSGNNGDYVDTLREISTAENTTG